VYNYFKLTILLVSFILLTGCSLLEEKQGVMYESEAPLVCEPADAVGCIGWAKDKPIMVD
jgi:hypothetical protein